MGCNSSKPEAERKAKREPPAKVAGATTSETKAAVPSPNATTQPVATTAKAKPVEASKGEKRTLLVVKCSLNGEESQSNKLIETFVASWKAKHDGTIVIRDLDTKPLEHLTQVEMGTWAMEADKLDEEQKKLVAISDELISEFKHADEVVVGMPMYNFWVPSTMKAWIDRLLRAGVTFKYTADGPQALLDDKPLYVLCTRGGVYTAETDTQTPYLKQTFGYIGLKDLTFVYVEGLAMGGPEKVKEAVEEGVVKVKALFNEGLGGAAAAEAEVVAEVPKEADAAAPAAGSKKLLVVHCSLNGAEGQSNVLIDQFKAAWTAKHAGDIIDRDLDSAALPHLDQPEMAAWMANADDRTDEQKESAAVSDALIAEFVAADEVVIGVPMYNFWIPSTLKAWIDRLLRAGVTFKYTATGVEALVDSKKIYFLCARGGVYTVDTDTQTPYLKQVFGFIGQTDLHFVYAEGFAMGGADGAAKAALAGKEGIEKLFA
ncbi:FMN-dependent NADH-azoreductase [Diplonema papillatum]|nr:FMN-dependent NADH-azoreductase [Diplonema papillatum]